MLGRSRRRRSRSNLTGATHARSWGGVLDHRIVFFGFRPDAKLASCTSHSRLYSCVRAAAGCTGIGRTPGCYNRDRPRCRHHRVRRPHSFLHLRPRTTFFLSHKERGGETVHVSTRTYIRFRQGRAHSRTAPPPAHSSRERASSLGRLISLTSDFDSGPPLSHFSSRRGTRTPVASTVRFAATPDVDTSRCTGHDCRPVGRDRDPGTMSVPLLPYVLAHPLFPKPIADPLNAHTHARRPCRPRHARPSHRPVLGTLHRVRQEGGLEGEPAQSQSGRVHRALVLAVLSRVGLRRDHRHRW